MFDVLVWLLLLPLRALWWLAEFDPILAVFAIVFGIGLLKLILTPEAVRAWRESGERIKQRRKP